MDKLTSFDLYSTEYNVPYAVKIQTPMVDEVLENKHGIDNPVVDLNIGGAAGAAVSNEIEGFITTTDGIGKVASITDVPLGKCITIYSVVSARQNDSSDYGSFIRVASFKNTAGTAVLRDQVQDSFSKQTTSSWETDFTADVSTVQIRVFGEAAVTISWHYRIIYLITD